MTLPAAIFARDSRQLCCCFLLPATAMAAAGEAGRNRPKRAKVVREVLQKLGEHFETYPEEAPAVLLDVLSRKYKKSDSAMDLLPNVSKICRLSVEVKHELIA
eukprot:8760789-Lingulodinium_polyedra.AAC.1